MHLLVIGPVGAAVGDAVGATIGPLPPVGLPPVGDAVGATTGVPVETALFSQMPLL